MKSIDLLKRHMGRPSVLKLKNKDGTEDEIEIQQLPFELIPEFWSLMKLFAGEKTDFYKVIDKEALKTINFLLLETMKLSIPDAEEYDLKRFITSNYFELMGKLFEVNAPVPTTDTRIKKRIEELRKKSKTK